ncbi:uncharacterized protein LOC115078085 [Rhinatrema bivittatum]|uniref:uncharacterized protein LOC115078085 n=1 Tax=Rhinatrema bivittatum TaxID=194408 RepID=UPI001125D769|nr:uncharacterized protein LOC115078085 [Rhinatrema bivittatum]
MGEFKFSLRALCQQELDKRQRKALHCHFSLRRKSGGGECQTSHLAGGEYRISFQDPADRDRVLAKERHIFKAGGESLEVLVRAEEQEEEGLLEEAREPKNDSASRLQSFLFQLDPYLLRFLQEHPEVSEILQQGLLKYHCTWSLPTEEKESEKERQILLSGSIDIPFQKWKSQVEDVLATFKQQYVCFYEFNLEKQQKLVGDAGLAKKSISIYHEPLQHFIVITGLARDVEELVDTMDLALLGQRNVISSTCSLGHPNKFSIIQEDLERELNLHFPKLQFCITQNKMDLKGTTEEVLWAQEKFQELLMDVKEHLIEVSLHKRQFLCSLHLADFQVAFLVVFVEE